jgi:hypothetical protein
MTGDHDRASRALQEAFDRLLARAPGPIFPRARRLYLLKYPLEGHGSRAGHRTFVHGESVDEAIEIDAQGRRIGVVTIRARELALVRWQPGGVLDPLAAADYLARTWGLPAVSLSLPETPWFRDAGPQARLAAPPDLLRVFRAPLPVPR